MCRVAQYGPLLYRELWFWLEWQRLSFVCVVFLDSKVWNQEWVDQTWHSSSQVIKFRMRKNSLLPLPPPTHIPPSFSSPTPPFSLLLPSLSFPPLPLFPLSPFLLSLPLCCSLNLYLDISQGIDQAIILPEKIYQN